MLYRASGHVLSVLLNPGLLWRVLGFLRDACRFWESFLLRQCSAFWAFSKMLTDFGNPGFAFLLTMFDRASGLGNPVWSGALAGAIKALSAVLVG